MSGITYIDGKKKLSTMQKAKIGAFIGLGVYVVVWEKKRVNGIIAMSQAAVLDTMQGSWEEGFKYGLKMAKEIGVEAAEKAEYAFHAFDKSA